MGQGPEPEDSGMWERVATSRGWRVARWLLSAALGLLVVLVTVLFGIALAMNLMGQPISPGGFVVSELRWLGRGGPYQTDFDGFGYTYETRDRQGVTEYRLRLTAHQPEKPKGGTFEYRRTRILLDKKGRLRRPGLITWRATPLTEAALAPVEQAVRTWPGRGEPKHPADWTKYPKLEFAAVLRVSGWHGGYRDWEYDNYRLQYAGKAPPRDVTNLIERVNQSLPAGVRAKWPLPKPEG
jgi:hypothetical protein